MADYLPGSTMNRRACRRFRSGACRRDLVASSLDGSSAPRSNRRGHARPGCLPPRPNGTPGPCSSQEPPASPETVAHQPVLRWTRTHQAKDGAAGVRTRFSQVFVPAPLRVPDRLNPEAERRYRLSSERATQAVVESCSDLLDTITSNVNGRPIRIGPFEHEMVQLDSYTATRNSYECTRTACGPGREATRPQAQKPASTQRTYLHWGAGFWLAASAPGSGPSYHGGEHRPPVVPMVVPEGVFVQNRSAGTSRTPLGTSHRCPASPATRIPRSCSCARARYRRRAACA